MTNPYDQIPSPVYTTPPTPPLSLGKKLTALFLFIAAVLLADIGLFGGFNAGYTVTMWIITILYFVFAGKGQNSFYSVACITLALANSVVYAIHNDSGLNFLLFCLHFVLLSAAICEKYQLGQYSTASFRSIADIIVLTIAYPFMSIDKALKALFTKNTVDKGRTGSVLAGVLCAVPVLLVVVPLLISADAAFEKMFGFIKDINLLRTISSLLVGTLLFGYWYAHAYGAGTRIYGNQKRAETVQNFTLSAPALLSFLGAISLFYVLYLLSQLTYFFSAFISETPANFLPSAYARRGFFEMCAICVINLTIMFAVILLSRRENGKISRPLAGICTFISLFSLLLIITAESKMFLYISRFGLTRLRLVTAIFMVFLAIIFIALILRLYITKFPYMKLLILSAAVICLLTGLADIDTTIARYNISAYQSGKLSSIDVDQLRTLDYSAAPYIFALLEDENQTVRIQAKDILNKWYSKLSKQYGSKFDARSFNYTHYRAYRLLQEYVKS